MTERQTSPIRMSFLGSCFDNVSEAEAFAVVDECIQTRRPGYMMSLNLDILIHANEEPIFGQAVAEATLVLMDSTPLMRVARHLGVPVKEKLSGSDLMPKVCAHAAAKGYTCYILGGMPGVPEQAKQNLEERYPGLRILGTLSPEYGFDKDEAAIQKLCQRVAATRPDILFVCLGDPKGGLFVHDCLQRMGVKFAFDVGAAVDFAAGNVSRAPRWMQDAGLEWLYRFAHEPKRLFKRYFVDSWRFVSIYMRHRRDS